MDSGRGERLPRAVIVISSHVARGSVGNRACVFALETLGHPVWAVPTLLLPWHPGHGPATRIVPPADAFAEFVADLAGAPWLGEVGAVLTGYLGAAGQAEPVAALVRAVRAASPDMLYVCDPVIGDQPGLYVDEAIAAAIRDVLLPLADIATPNRFELEWLARRPLADNFALIDAARALGPARVLVTSAYPLLAGGTGNLLVGDHGTIMAEHRMIPRPPHGLGDLTASLLLARLQAGLPEEKALSKATASVFELLARTAKRGADELTLETDASSLLRPMAMVQLRRLLETSPDRLA